jgi:hypothetical protein
MKFLAKLATGGIALWCVFWLIGTPLSLVWDAGVFCMVTRCGVQEPWIASLLTALFTLSCVAIVFVSVAMWRSASNYPRDAWWKTPLAILAKLCAAFSVLVATFSFLFLLYLDFFIYVF